jgi:hypothetical protein
MESEIVAALWLGGLGAAGGLALGGVGAEKRWSPAALWAVTTPAATVLGFAVILLWASTRTTAPGEDVAPVLVAAVSGFTNGVCAAVALPVGYMAVRSARRSA